ncbi:MAG: type II toxin-antitoxin system PemK/MazF family toxin [Candidatus Vogelbacteria bacterium]|nr:type II toxin-antitoxin system PemK/MazF family toxin [Candidatus Vogelbacteria bacterium]
MVKDYKHWHKNKNIVEGKQKRVFFHEREIWLCHLGENVGFEEDGRGNEFLRPVVILRKFNNEIFWAVPLTKTTKKGSYYFVFLFSKEVKSAALLSQLKLIDAKRLKYKMSVMKEDDFMQLKQRIRQLIA